MRRVAYALSALVSIASAAPSSEAARATVESARGADPRPPEGDPQNRRELQAGWYGGMGNPGTTGNPQQAAMRQVPSLLAASVNAYQTGIPARGALQQSNTPMMDSLQNSISSGVSDFSWNIAQFMAPHVIEQVLPTGVEPADLVRQMMQTRDLMTESINFITGVQGVAEELELAGLLPLTNGVELEQPVVSGSGGAARTPLIDTPAFARVSALMPQRTTQSSSMLSGAMSALTSIFGR